MADSERTILCSLSVTRDNRAISKPSYFQLDGAISKTSHHQDGDMAATWEKEGERAERVVALFAAP